MPIHAYIIPIHIYTHTHMHTLPYIYIYIYIYIYTVGPRLSESPLSEPWVIRRLFRILKSQKIV